MSFKSQAIMSILLSYYLVIVFPELITGKASLFKRLINCIFWPIAAKKNKRLLFEISRIAGQAVTLFIMSKIVFYFIKSSMLGMYILIGLSVIPKINMIVIIPSTLFSLLFWIPFSRILKIDIPSEYMPSVSFPRK